MQLFLRTPLPFLLATLVGTLSASGATQESYQAPLSVIAASSGLQPAVNGEFLGGGDGYRVRFKKGAIEFTPALGTAAPRTMPLGLSLAGIERGGKSVVSVDAAAAPTLDGKRIAFLHGNNVEERYEVAPEGIYQSFWFPEVLPGSGDLVVRFDVETELTGLVDQQADQGARFELAGVGSVTYGTVTGIDARGRTVAGKLQFDGKQVLLSLPAAFIDRASYPLLLDPLIGTQFDISSGSTQDGGADVAYDGDNAEYLVVWTRVFSLVDSEIRGQRVQNTGTLVGATLFLTSTLSTINLSPSVGSVDLHDRFVVAFQQLVVGSGTPVQIKAVAVDAGSGSISNSIVVSSSSQNQSNAAVGGDRGTIDNEAVVVWEESGVGVLARQVSVGPTGDPFGLGSTTTIAANDLFTEYSEPAISRSGGDTGDFLVTYTLKNLFTSRTNIAGHAFDRNLVSISLPRTISSASVTNDEKSAVDGDGEYWIVAYQREETVGSTDHDIVLTAVRIDSFGALVYDEGEILLEADANDDETQPAVAFVGKHTVIAYEDTNSQITTIYLKSVDPFTGLPSPESLTASSNFRDGANCAVASQYSGGGSLVTTEAFDDALVVFDQMAAGGTDFDINAIRYDAGTELIDLGGDCGSGGELQAPCTFAGNQNFRIHLQDAPPNSLAFLSISGGSTSVTCGPCTLITALDGSNSTFTAMTDSRGYAAFPQPIPLNVSGSVAYAQTLTFLPGGPCPLFTSVRLSNGLEITID